MKRFVARRHPLMKPNRSRSHLVAEDDRQNEQWKVEENCSGDDEDTLEYMEDPRIKTSVGSKVTSFAGCLKAESCLNLEVDECDRNYQPEKSPEKVSSILAHCSKSREVEKQEAKLVLQFQPKSRTANMASLEYQCLSPIVLSSDEEDRSQNASPLQIPGNRNCSQDTVVRHSTNQRNVTLCAKNERNVSFAAANYTSVASCAKSEGIVSFGATNYTSVASCVKNERNVSFAAANYTSVASCAAPSNNKMIATWSMNVGSCSANNYMGCVSYGVQTVSSGAVKHDNVSRVENIPCDTKPIPLLVASEKFAADSGVKPNPQKAIDTEKADDTKIPRSTQPPPMVIIPQPVKMAPILSRKESNFQHAFLKHVTSKCKSVDDDKLFPKQKRSIKRQPSCTVDELTDFSDSQDSPWKRIYSEGDCKTS